MAFVLTEYDIFKHLVVRDNEDITGVKDKTRKMLSRLPINIFTDEYYILYKSLEQANKYGVVLTYENFHHMVLANIDDMVRDSNVTLFSEGDFTDIERGEKILDYCLVEYDRLVDAEVEDENSLLANIEFYVGSWAKEKMREITYNQLDILEEGKKVGNKVYRGVTDAKAYSDRAYAVIRSLMDADANALSENIDTSTDSTEDIKEKLEDEATSDVVAYTGVDELDKYYEFHRGEIVVVQAGTGVGKTRFSTGISYNGLKMKSNVLYISLEQKSTKIFPMVMARHALEKFGDHPDLDDKSIINKTYSYDKLPMVDEVLRDINESPDMGKIRVEGRSIEAEDLYDYLVDVWESGFHFDIVNIDYLGLLETRGGNRYEKLTNVVNMIKTEVKSFKGQGFLAILPNQLTPEAELKMAQGDLDGMTKTGGSETQYISRAGDYIFTLEQDNVMRMMNRMICHVSKVRSGTIIKPKVEMLVDLGKVVYMDAEDSDENEDY